MKRSIISTLIICSISVVAHAESFEDTGLTTVFIGASNMSSKLDGIKYSGVGVTFGADFGFNQYASIYANGTYNSIDDSNFSGSTNNTVIDSIDGWAFNARLMGKLGYPIQNLSGNVKLTPFVTAGLGAESYVTHYSVGSDRDEEGYTATSFVYGLGADIVVQDEFVIGLSYNRSKLDTSKDQATATIGYRF